MFPVICLLFLSNENLPNLFYMIDFTRLKTTNNSIRYSLSNIIRNPVVNLPDQNNKKVSSFIGLNVLLYIENSERFPDKYGSLNTSNVTGNSTIYFKLFEYKTELLFIFYGKALLEMEVYPSEVMEKPDKLFLFATASVQNNSINCKILFKKEEVEWYKHQKTQITEILKEEDFLNINNILKSRSWYDRVSNWNGRRLFVTKEYLISMWFIAGFTSMLYIVYIISYIRGTLFNASLEQPNK